MTDRTQHAGDEATAGVRALLQALQRAAGESGTRESLMELGGRARGLVEELGRRAREQAAEAARRTAADSSAREAQTNQEIRREAAGPGARDGALASVHRGLEQTRSMVAEVADVLEAAVERLSTLESQLGEPGRSVEAAAREGIARCEALLGGLGYRLDRGAAAARPSGPDATAATGGHVLVVGERSASRAAACLLLEHQGMRTMAAPSLERAVALAARMPLRVALLVPVPGPGLREWLARWMETAEQGSLPAAAVLAGRGDGETAAEAARLGLPCVRADHGDAAVAASLAKLAAQQAPARARQDDGPEEAEHQSGEEQA